MMKASSSAIPSKAPSLKKLSQSTGNSKVKRDLNTSKSAIHTVRVDLTSMKTCRGPKRMDQSQAWQDLLNKSPTQKALKKKSNFTSNQSSVNNSQSAMNLLSMFNSK